MRSLFAKIFLWFWLAIIIAGLATIVVTVIFPSQAVIIQLKNYFSFNLSTVGKMGADLYEKDGPDALDDFLGQIDTISTFRLHMFSSRGESLRKNQLPPGTQKIVAHSLADDAVHFQEVFTHPLVAVRTTGGSGRAYVILLEMPKGLLQLFFSFSTGQLLKTVAAILASGIVCLLLARYLTAPIRKLQTAVRRFAQGDMAVRVAPDMGKRRDEIAVLGHDFDAMAAQIESLMSAHEHLLRDVAHELRSPLTRLNVALEITRKHTGTEAERFIDRIAQETDKLSQLITQLLTWSRLENTDLTIQLRPVALEEIISRIAKDAGFEGMARHRSVAFTCQEPCTLQADGNLIRSAVENVVRNALRFTPDDTQVEIEQSVVRRDGMTAANIIVKDLGPGIDEAAMGNLFKPFFKADHPKDRTSGGTGLGLAIAQRAISLHHGQIRAENRTGGGLVVKIELPMRISDQDD